MIPRSIYKFSRLSLGMFRVAISSVRYRAPAVDATHGARWLVGGPSLPSGSSILSKSVSKTVKPENTKQYPDEQGLSSLLAAIIGLVFLKTYVFDFHDTMGPSMLPTIMIADDVVAIDNISVQLPGGKSKIRRNEVVIACKPSGDTKSSTVCKRAIAFEGDVVVTRMGIATRIPPGHVWLEGDNPENSKDSRHYGPVPLAAIQGRVVGIVSPPWRAQWIEPTEERPAVSKWPGSKMAVRVFRAEEWEQVAVLEHLLTGLTALDLFERAREGYDVVEKERARRYEATEASQEGTSSDEKVLQHDGEGEGEPWTVSAEQAFLRQVQRRDALARAICSEVLSGDTIGGSAGALARRTTWGGAETASDTVDGRM